MITVVLFSITALFFVFLFLKPFFDKIFHVRLCALCASVAVIWISMLFLDWFTTFSVDRTLLALLMGGSVVGVVYTFSLEKKEFHRPLLGLFSFLTGIMLAYVLITNRFDVWSLLILFPLLLLAYLFDLAPKKHLSPLGKKLEKRLERCCS